MANNVLSCVVNVHIKDRHHCFKSGNISKTKGVQILSHLCRQWHDLHDTQLTQIGFVGAIVLYREHGLAYPSHIFQTCCGPEAFNPTTIFEKCV